MRRFRDIIEDIKAPSPQSLWLDKGELKFFGTKGWTSMVGGGGEDRQELEEKVDSLDKEMGTANDNIRKLQNGKLTCLQLQIGDSDTVKQSNLKELQGIAGFFFTELDYGYGVGTFQAGVGGFAHVVTAYDNDAYYDIAADGAISKNSNYISPNEPYTVNLTSEQIDVTLDDVTASKVANCGEIIITGTTGTITYTRTADSTSAAVYFSDERKDGKITVLTYTASTKKITPAVINPYLPAASTSAIGGVKMVNAIEDIVASSATAESVANKLNDVLAALRTAGILNT
nr:MAG TPA: Head fiber protein [Crassvirales sp.]